MHEIQAVGESTEPHDSSNTKDLNKAVRALGP